MVVKLRSQRQLLVVVIPSFCEALSFILNYFFLQVWFLLHASLYKQITSKLGEFWVPFTIALQVASRGTFCFLCTPVLNNNTQWHEKNFNGWLVCFQMKAGTFKCDNFLYGMLHLHWKLWKNKRDKSSWAAVPTRHESNIQHKIPMVFSIKI